MSPYVSWFTYYTSSLEIVYNTTCIIRIVYERRACHSICRRRRPAHFVVKLGQLIILLLCPLSPAVTITLCLSLRSLFLSPAVSLSHTLTTSLSPRQSFSHCLYIVCIIYNAHFLLLCALLPHVCTTYSSRTHILYVYVLYL